ncbi:FRAS1-related extracellular matrix protein 1b isoform X3 [Syngnathoides biaculeatus]|uniref:FRAS1-related extracellular matrix protein 1b isoform X3 n=1 Tax=Syngnathoides biaculeatus TaxID=300417 RepID=UPI002ADD6FA0|nr:FRAS1-related extracellular matrix protein 1b isoform X3 [Syngnathoides biaculeatus]
MAALRALLLLLLAGALSPTTGARVEVNAGMEVARGRRAFLGAEHLRIAAEADAHCKVEVVLNEPITQRVGRLTPQVFDCNFLPEEVSYQHNGSPLLNRDQVLLRVYWFGSSETSVESALLRIRVADRSSGLATLGTTPLAVPVFYGLSNAIDDSVVNIRNPGRAACTVRLLAAAGALTAGRLVRDDGALQRTGREAPCPGKKACASGTEEAGFLKTGCRDFLSSGLKYRHLSPPSPDLDYVAVSVELREQDGGTPLETESLWLPVRIVGATPNQPPRAAFVASFILEVDQFILTPITTAALDAEDPETPKDGLVFNVSAPPPRGYVTHLDRPTGPVGSFTWTDLHHLKVAYRPPNSSRPTRDNFRMEFRAIDASHAASPPLALHVSIKTAETNAPRVSWNTGLDLLEGQSRAITWAELQIVDRDDVDDRVFLVAVDGPRHGRLSVRGAKAFTFSVRDLREGAVVYEHSGSDTTHDRVVFRISDGRHSVRHKFPINIVPRDDAPPFLVNNVALEVPEGGALRLDPSALLASDLDSDDERILFTVDVPPRAGRIVAGTSPRDPGVPVAAFLQRDLVGGSIFYRHSGDEIFEDSFDVTLADAQTPPNLSHAYTVVVRVFPVEDQLPVESPGRVRHVTVKETQVAYITRAHLHFTHPEHPQAELTYNVTRPCYSPRHPGLIDAGRLFYVDGVAAPRRDPTAPALKSFTQHAVDHLKVAYMPPLEDIGPDRLDVQLVLSVSERRGGAVAGVVFNITVTPVDDQAPQAFSNLLRVEEGGWALVTEEHLLVRDRDTRSAAIGVEVGRAARRGRLELRGRSLRRGDAFTLADLRGLAVRYVHDDSETAEDDVGLRVTDGVNAVDVDLLVQVLPVNDEPPQLGDGLRDDLRCPEGGRVQVTADYLAATDRDSDDAKLSYTLARRPARGELRKGGLPVDKFSQQDLLRGLVFYVHTGGEIGPVPASDAVTLVVSDGDAGGTDGCRCGDAPPVPLHGTLPVYDLNVTLLPVNDKVPAVILGLRLWYAHDGSEASEDRLTLHLTDGVHSLSASAAVSVLPVDDHPPRLLRNAGVRAEPGVRRALTAALLRAHDADTSPRKLFYLLEAAPRLGKLHLKTSETDRTELAAGHNFTQDDVDANRLSYTAYANAGADGFRFGLSDLVHRSSAHVFNVTIHAARKGDISLWTGAVPVAEGQRAVLNTDFLRAADGGGRPDELVYAVTAAPRHGLLHDVARPGVPLSAFTQMDVAAQRVCYTHDNGHRHHSDAFSFAVSNGERSRTGSVLFSIQAADRVPPTLEVNAGAAVAAGGTAAITAEHLRLSDARAAASDLSFALVRPPRSGSLLLRGVPLGPAGVFTQADVDGGRLAYRHDGGPAPDDAFRFLPGDGRDRGYLRFGRLRTEPAVFRIHVRRPDRSPPILTRLGRPSEVVQLSDGRRAILITSRHLRAADDRGAPERLQFAVVTPPRFGHLENIHTGSYVRGRFTQRDVERRSLIFVVPTDVDATDDDFLFRLSDPAGNAASPQTLRVSWSRIELSASCFRTCETAERLQIEIRRRGTSADPAYVAIRVQDGTAEAGRDFTHSTAALIQFDPGVHRKTWSVYPEADDLEEGEENLTVTLADPKNAVLGRTASARVEIVDPRGGRCDLGAAPPPPPVAPTADDSVPDVEAELIWESAAPPRGDVPDRRHSGPGKPPQSGRAQEEVARGAGSAGLEAPFAGAKPDRRVWTFHALTSLREEAPAGHERRRRSDVARRRVLPKWPPARVFGRTEGKHEDATFDRLENVQLTHV